MSVRLMHLADLHLGAPLSYLGDKAEERTRDLESAFSRALTLAPERNVHAVVIAGDLFDTFNPASDLVERVRTAFGQITKSGIPVILIPGTHDSQRYSRCVYRRQEFPGVEILLDEGTPVRKNLNGQMVYFYGFSGGTTTKSESSSFRRGEEEGIHIALVHGSVTEGTHWPAGPRDYSLQPADLEASSFDYVALGHYHNFREFRVGPVSAIYPGTLEGLKFGENGERCLIIAEVDDSGVTLEKTKHNRKALSEIRMDLAMEGIESDEELSDAIEKLADPGGIMKVYLSGTANFLPAKQRIRTRLADRFFYLQIVDETSLFRSEMVRSAMHENTVRGIFVRRMLQEIEESSAENREAMELALRLGIEQFTRIRDENQQTLD